PSFGFGFCVAAVNANGVGFDTSFGGTGQTFLPLPAGYPNAVINSIALQPDGKLLVGGTCFVSATLPANSSVCVARLTTGGIFDAGFGTSNWSLTTPGPGDALIKLIVLPDGRYYAVAECANTSHTTSYICAGLFFANGVVQRTLATDISSRSDRLYDARVFGSQLSLQWAAFDNVSAFNTLLYAARREAYTLTGAYDNSFGGYPSAGIAGAVNLDASNDGIPSVGTILSDGSFLYYGVCNFPAATPVLCSTRLTPNGVLDSSYGVGGRFEYGGQNAPWATVSQSSLAVYTASETPDQKVLVAGLCYDTGGQTRPCVTRLMGGPQTARACTMDIDGDGVINPLTDGLILVRTMLGLSGTAALAGAVGPGAARPDWPRVREYLFDQCRMPVPVL
ncbi:MAG: hypothetical protein ACRCWJ_05195, partial [Casimicrobium sp.]